MSRVLYREIRLLAAHHDGKVSHIVEELLREALAARRADLADRLAVLDDAQG